ncbi:MAG TPA: hypothetical protein P5205_18010 [Candidatus Paceibacterota bacterium]|nr:hypothetical protein [Verrucomicrobiota bacterium]HSA12259.1 hypothetical protein [Candidatus Paceibacterota bacterium]
MKKTLYLLFLVGATSALLVGCGTTHHVTRWEYRKAVNLSDSQLNELGEQGWRVVGFTTDESTTPMPRTTYLLQRPKK